jgi:hypothetical protein
MPETADAYLDLIESLRRLQHLVAGAHSGCS